MNIFSLRETGLICLFIIKKLPLCGVNFQVGQQHEEKKVIVVDTGVLTSPVPDARHDNDDNREHVGELAVTIIVECQNMATNTEAEAPTERRDWATSYSPIPDFASSFAQTELPLHQHDEESQVQEPEENGEALTVRNELNEIFVCSVLRERNCIIDGYTRHKWAKRNLLLGASITGTQNKSICSEESSLEIYQEKTVHCLKAKTQKSAQN